MVRADAGAAGVRGWYLQAKCWGREHVHGPWDLRTEWRVARNLALPRLPRRPVGPRTEVWAVSVVRDEADVVGASVAHLLDQGVDHVLVADHLSVDGTRDLLEGVARRDTRVHVAVDAEPGHRQMEKMSHLARAAWLAGAAWVVPFDADEFWFAERGSLAEFLLDQEVSVVHAHTFHMLPLEPSTGDPEDLRRAQFVVDTGGGYGKVAFRTHPLALVAPGNHGAARVGGQGDGLRIAHLPYRGPEQMARKYATGAVALDRAGAPEAEGWHWRAGARLTATDTAGVWAEMLKGRPVPEVGWEAIGPFVRARPLTWRTWDPEGLLARGPSALS